MASERQRPTIRQHITELLQGINQRRQAKKLNKAIERSGLNRADVEGAIVNGHKTDSRHQEESRNLVGGAPFSPEVTSAVEQNRNKNRPITFIRGDETYIRIPLGNGTFAEHEVK